MTFVTPEEALSLVSSGARIFIHAVAATPTLLLRALAQRKDLNDIHIYHIHTEGEIPYLNQVQEGRFHIHTFFIGSNLRDQVCSGNADYIPIFLSEIPALFRKKVIELDFALVQVSPPDRNGYCSLGVSVDIARAAVDTAKQCIVEVNEQMPRTHGNSYIHESRIAKAVKREEGLYERKAEKLSDTDFAIGKNVSNLIEDGSTLQMGIGKIPDATLQFLKDRKDLGIHSEMISDGILELIQCGAVTGRFKKKHPGKIVSGFAYGSKDLYSYLDDNPLFEFHDIAYVNDTYIIAQNPKVTAINSALEIDLTGQVCADSIGTSLYSGVGGQMDFIRAASISEGGKPIIAMPSTTRRGGSKIVPVLKPGAGVVTTRAHVHYIVTEYGVADLYGMAIPERVKSLIEIAHPDHRERLAREAYSHFRINCG